MSTKTIDARIEEILARMTEHELFEITAPDATVRAFYLKKPGTRIEATLITFTPEGIAVQGDQTPSTNGNVSALGYGLAWFAGRKDPDYLAEKFLSKRWVWESARDHMHSLAEQYETNAKDEDGTVDDDAAKQAKECRRIIVELDARTSQHEFVEMLQEAGFDYDGEGWDYDPREVALLSAIQRRFAALYAARETARGAS